MDTMVQLFGTFNQMSEFNDQYDLYAHMISNRNVNFVLKKKVVFVCFWGGVGQD